MSRKRFDFSRFGHFFVLTFVASLVVTGGVSYLSGEFNAWNPIWQSAVIAILVGAGATRSAGHGAETPVSDRTPAGPANDESGSAAAATSGPGSRNLESLEEQGITVKLLELTALGDRYGNVFSVAMIGVDYLEDIREQYDKEVVHQLLDKVSKALAHTLRMPDRVGEFEHGTYLVVLPETQLRGAIQIAERMRDAVSHLDVAVSDRVHIHTTASVGVTSFRRGDDLHSLVRRAEKALREAQKQGRNRVLPDMAA